MEKLIIFNKTNTSKSFRINNENPFFKITKVAVPSVKTGEKNMTSKIPSAELFYVIKQASGSWQKNYIFHDLTLEVNPHQIEAVFVKNAILTNRSFDISIELVFGNNSELDEDVYVYYTMFDHKIDISNPFVDFEQHLEFQDNAKILFSAPFGQGKTTFLNIFFEQHKNEYEVFNLFPVNYAVSHNEDIFKYIKVELLWQLLKTDVEFEKEKFSYLQTAPEFFKTHGINLLAPLVGLFPKVDKSILSVFEKLHALSKEYFDFHKKTQKDEAKEAINFIDELIKKEGSLFEDNFYTQLIRQLLSQLSEVKKKKAVLIIDDIDRMDPEHVFRIFNVFAAHFDSIEMSEGLTNKFGFDKIIIVCDYKNIQRVFAHRYGVETSFDGYINKYYSRNPFFYENKKAIEAMTKIIFERENRNCNVFPFNVLDIILKDLLYVEELSLRDVLKLSKQNVNITIQGSLFKKQNNLKWDYNKFVLFNIISYLSKALEIDTLISKIKKCKTTVPKHRDIYISRITTLGFVPLVYGPGIENKKHFYSFADNIYEFTVRSERLHELGFEYYDVAGIENNTHPGKPLTFTMSDFYDVLLLNALKFKEVGGFD